MTDKFIDEMGKLRFEKLKVFLEKYDGITPQGAYDLGLDAGARGAYEWCDKNISEHPEYNKLIIFFEQFSDLSGCYDSEDIVNIGQSWVNKFEALQKEGDALAEALMKQLTTVWKNDSHGTDSYLEGKEVYHRYKKFKEQL